ncbi:hypothetical protein M3M39_00730 [Fructilactobacillus hinvesii]|uniref:AbrB family transcriptional regulator n=1 Tax=Fructilactobacillus hinvesii TaxID=2940300 RepID=A0ABY5BSF2_9LACO|nr:hypothetical protein [Fructilactobacillus hinvesii]USS88044.1 hypothetical protein M3M39_00730 [Fructilactobacillus hinvesii]
MTYNDVLKVRKVGNSKILTVPNGIEVNTGEEFRVVQNSDQSITYIPVKKSEKDQIDPGLADFMDRFKPLMEKLKDR